MRWVGVAESLAAVLTRAGLGADDVQALARDTETLAHDGGERTISDLPVACELLRRIAHAGESLLERLPEPPQRRVEEVAAAAALGEALATARRRFLAAHARCVYATATSDGRRRLRVETLLASAGDAFPGLQPGTALLSVERSRRLADKDGVETAQALLLGAVLALPDTGRHLVESMREPAPEAQAALAELERFEQVDLDFARVRRQGPALHVELRNPRHLNAEDDHTNRALELAVDLALLYPGVDVGVLRGSEVEHGRYRGARVFGAGLNLTRLAEGKLPYSFFPTRELGLVNKLFRGICGDDVIEKPWIAAVDTFAIGGGLQLLLVMDHVIAAHDAYFSLPARNEGIIPGAANLRLARFVGQREARRLVYGGDSMRPGDAAWSAVCDQTQSRHELDGAIAQAIERIVANGSVSTAANRRALRLGQEPDDAFREYMAAYVEDQARCMFAGDLAETLERRWLARGSRRGEEIAS